MEFPERDSIIRKVQTALNLVVDGKDGFKTWSAILLKIVGEQPVQEPVVASSELNQKSLDLIVKYEVGGGISYYNKYLKRPCWPGGASGVTIGIGYDLGYNSRAQFESDWSDILTVGDYNTLLKCVGVTGAKANTLSKTVKTVEIDWDDALAVFKVNTVPRFIKETLKAFPGADKLHPDAFGALVSLVFNRGGSTTGERRKEMYNIKKLVLDKDYNGIANEIVKMKKLWVGQGLDGLLTRRDEEAAIIRACA